MLKWRLSYSYKVGPRDSMFTGQRIVYTETRDFECAKNKLQKALQDSMSGQISELQVEVICCSNSADACGNVYV